MISTPMTTIRRTPGIPVSSEGGSYDVLVNGNCVCRIVYRSEYCKWAAHFVKFELCGYGDSPAKAISNALGARLSSLQDAVTRAKALSVEHGDQLMKLAEGLK